MLRTSVTACCLLAVFASATHPRPEFSQYASFARWLVHESDYAVVSTHHGGSGVFGNIVSISDGDGYEDSTGVIYTYLPDLDATYEDVMANSEVALTFTEMALAGGQSGGCKNSTAENPPCARLTISGRLTKVPKEQEATALRYLFKRHPEMRGWGAEHHFMPFWMAKENITDFFLINFYGGAKHPTVKDYLAAPWHGGKAVNSSALRSPADGSASEAQRSSGQGAPPPSGRPLPRQPERR
eukprot:CAMPEP_0171171858 /NCGR_PEP_ID=MMETSP0790-20130122/9427_1 /TAXON_ID=2925 /ORGANISM="Alexandrium catenella, Strain OF101" /LENGTH=240 /DNA_ID=CAMNT_0011636711 /DNA_START=40 /DNA_END=759 /DNA_ORIENTATION=+